MRRRVEKAWVGVRRVVAAAAAAVTSVIGPEEIAIYAGLALLAVGCWQVWRPAAYLLPGAVMVWMYLPTREPFIARGAPAIDKKKPRTD